MKLVKIIIISFLFFSSVNIFAQNQQEEVFSDICFVDSSVAYITSKSKYVLSYPSDIISAIYKTDDGGASWKRLVLNISDVINNITFTSQDTGYITSYYSSKLFKTTNGGMSWDSIYTFQNEIRDMKFLNSKVGFIVGVYLGENIYKTIDGGNIWDFYFSGSNQFVGTTLSIVNDDIIYSSNWYSDLAKSTDGGINWNTTDNVIHGHIISILDMHFVSENTGFIIGNGVCLNDINQNCPIFIYTNNGGLNWEMNFYSKNSNLKDMSFINDNEGWLLFDNYIHHTKDMFATTDSINLSLNKFDFSDDNISIGINSNEIYKTNDGWKTYTKLFTLTNVKDEENISPLKFNLSQNYPNPFNPTTTISYSINNKSKIYLELFNVLGVKIKTLVNEHKSQGSYNYNLDISEFPSGVYIYRLSNKDNSISKKLLHLK